MSDPVVVVGSGPAGTACSLALLANGHTVVMLDAGLTLDEDTRKRVTTLHDTPPQNWPVGATDFMYNASAASARGLSMKRLFGSDFPYRGTQRDLPLNRGGTSLLPSFAQGGFSSVWGASILPLRPYDFLSWPIARADLEPHYRAVMEEIPLAARHDALEDSFPLYSAKAEPLLMSRQSQSLLNHLDKHRDTLNDRHIVYGASRLAVRADHGSGCTYCAQCLVGCPYDAIYCATDTLAKLEKDPRFTYRSKWIVKRVTESGNSVEISGIDYDSRAPQRLRASRVFLAAGALASTRIMLESMHYYDRPVSMATSQHFMVPWIQQNSTSGVKSEAQHTLAQIFMEFGSPETPSESIHLQFYSYNRLMEKALERLGLGYVLRLSRELHAMVYGRLMITQGYLHSAASGSITLTLNDRDGEEPVLKMEAEPSPKSKPILRALMKRLWSLSDIFGAWPVTPMLSISPLGGGYHAGGTFPMRESPKDLESDRWGRPYGYERVHLADSSVLPDIASTPVTLNVMANAHRIGSFHG